jgi:hypothetical protein
MDKSLSKSLSVSESMKFRYDYTDLRAKMINIGRVSTRVFKEKGEFKCRVIG